MKWCAVFLFGLVCLLTLGAQDAQIAQTQHHAALLEAPLHPQERDPLLEDILATELTAMLNRAQIGVGAKRLALPEGADQPALPQEERVSRLLAGADASGADVIVAAFYLAEGDALTIQFALYDPAVKVVLGGVLARARKGLTVFASASSAVGDFEPAVTRYVEGGYRVDPPSGLVERIVVSGPQEGSRVVLVDKDFGTVSGGRLVVPYTQFQVGASIPVRVMKDGYHTYSGTLSLPSPQVDLAIPPLYRETRMDLQMRWSFGFATGMGLGVRFHIVPDELFAGLEAYRSLEAYSIQTDPVRHYDINARVGGYFLFPYSSFFRIQASLGAGVIVTDVQGVGGRDYTDYYVVIGDPTAELKVAGITFFVRPDIHYALGLGYNLLGREWIRTPYGLPPLTIGAGLSW